MRTTLDLDEDVLGAAKELARRQHLSAGQVVSQLLRRALTGQEAQSATSPHANAEPGAISGFRPFPAGRAVATNGMVNRLRDAEGV